MKQAPKKYKKTNHSNFSSIAFKVTNPIITDVDLLQMKMYQLELINTMLYEPPKTSGTIDNYKTNRLLSEIQRIDKWLKKHWEDFINDNNRLQSELLTA